MNISYVGNFTQRHCTEVHLAFTLESLGHTVDRIQEDPSNAVSFMKRVKNSDLFLFTRTWSNLVTLDHLAEMKQAGIPSVSYHLDLYVGLKREDGLDNDPFWRTEYVFSPDGDPNSAEVFKRKGINHFWMPPGVYHKECYLAPRSGIPNDVIFVGGGCEYGHIEWPYRRQLVTWLKDTYGSKYSKHGWPESFVRNEDLNKLYANSKISIGDSVCINFTHEKYWSDRVFETVGRGGFIIHPMIKGMEDYFTPDKELVYYEFGNFVELKEKIDYYLTHDTEREAIRKAGFKRVLEDHTYRSRLQGMIQVVKRERN